MYHAIYYVKIQPYYASFCFLGNAIIKKYFLFFRKRRTRAAMIRLLGTRLFTRLLLLICSLSLLSLLFLSRCSLNGLDTTSSSAEETEIHASFLSGKLFMKFTNINFSRKIMYSSFCH